MHKYKNILFQMLTLLRYSLERDVKKILNKIRFQTLLGYDLRGK